MNIFSILAAVGLLALAGCCGVLLGIIEREYMNENKRK